MAGHPDPEITRGLGPVSKKIILALRASVWSKNNEEGGGEGRGGAGKPDTSLGSASANAARWCKKAC